MIASILRWRAVLQFQGVFKGSQGLWWFWSVLPTAAIQAAQSGGDIILDAATVITVPEWKQLPWGEASQEPQLILFTLSSLCSGLQHPWEAGLEKRLLRHEVTQPHCKPPQLSRPSVLWDVDSTLSLPEWSARLQCKPLEVDCGAHHL